MARVLPTILFALAAVLLAFAPRAAAAESGGSHKRTTTSATFIEFPGLAVAVVDGSRPAGVLQVEFGIEAPQAALYDRILHLQPRVRAECAEALRAYAGDMYLVGTPPDADQIAAMLQARVDQTLGAQGAQIILAMVIVHGAR
jgi:hypothetical protein